MKKNVTKSVILTTLLASAGLGTTLAQAREFGVVISSTPVLQQVSVPHQVCTTAQVQSQYRTGGGALLGAVVGGALGNQFGKGNCRAVSTLIGAVGGGMVGDQIEVQNAYPVTQNVQQCHTENTLENRTVAYNVLYEYAGQRYTVEMPQHPGTRIALQVSPVVGQVVTNQAVAVQAMAQPAYFAPPVQTVTYQPVYQPINYMRPAVAVAVPVYDAYAPRPDYGPNHWHNRDREESRRDWR